MGEAKPLLSDEDDDVISAHLSLQELIRHSRAVLRNVNTLIASETQLAAVHGPIATMTTYVSEAISQRNTGKLVSAFENSNNLLNALVTLPTVSRKEDLSSVAEGLDQFHEQFVELLGDVQSRTSTLRDEIAELGRQRDAISEDIDAKKTALETYIDEFEEQLSEDQKQQEESYTAEFAAVQTKLDEAIARANTYYDEDVGRHDEQLKTFRTEFDQFAADQQSHYSEMSEQHAQQAAELLQDLQDKLTEGQKLVGMISEVTMTGHYQRNAEQQKRSADIWRIATVVAIVATVASAVVVAYVGYVNRTEPGWWNFVHTAGVTLALSALSAFLAKQTRSHRQRETQYRSLELELATLDPFLSTMSDDDRHRIKSDLASRYFVGTASSTRASRDVAALLRRTRSNQPNVGEEAA